MPKITIYQTTCQLCKVKLSGLTPEDCQRRLKEHLADCHTAQVIRDWEAKGIYKEMIDTLRYENLMSDLRKLLKLFTIEEIRGTLRDIENQEKEEL